jgi:hypothetical protein
MTKFPILLIIPLLGGCAVIPYDSIYNVQTGVTYEIPSYSYPSYTIIEPFPGNVPLTFRNYGRYMLGIGGYRGGHYYGRHGYYGGRGYEYKHRRH